MRGSLESAAEMNDANIGEEPGRKHTLREKARKTFIILLMVATLAPVFVVNIGVNAEQVKWAAPLAKLNQPIPSLQALLLCQQWTLFSQMSPFNFTFLFAVQLQDGQTIVLRDLDKEQAGKWRSVFFHNEQKTELNMYSDPSSQRRYLEYLTRTNGIDPLTIAHRTIYLRYQSVFPRQQAAQAGTYYGPETDYVLDTY